jgi:DNA-binding PucR family transcriptional regulator
MVAERMSNGLVRYGDVALIAAALRDPDLGQFLIETYVGPLERDRMAFRETIVAFFGSNWNASSTAAALGVSRQTVASRLRMVEEQLGQPLGQCSAVLETALRLAGLKDDDGTTSWARLIADEP